MVVKMRMKSMRKMELMMELKSLWSQRTMEVLVIFLM
jgi:hypothetical protein